MYFHTESLPFSNLADTDFNDQVAVVFGVVTVAPHSGSFEVIQVEVDVKV